MTTIKCRKCGKVYPFEQKICPKCGYDIRLDESLSPRDRRALGLGANSSKKLSNADKVSDEDMELWKSQTKEERQATAWEKRNEFGLMPDQGGLPRLNIPLRTMLLFTVVFVVFVILMKTR